MKKMIINCASCDARTMKEDALAGYEQVVINAATLLVTPRTKDLLNRSGTVLNVADVLEVPEGENVRVRNHNGTYELTGDRAPQAGEISFLSVNGMLIIRSDALEAALAYRRIRVNGSVLMPRSMSGKLSNLSVNGSNDTYPDGAVLLRRNSVIDKTFVLRAREGALYYAFRRLVFTDSSLDVAQLQEKGIRFAARKALIAESLAEEVSSMLTDDTEIIVVPDGTCFVNQDVKMNKRFLKKYGSRVYINGDLTVETDAEEVLPQIEYLFVNGDVKISEEMADAFEELEAEYQELIILKKTGKIIKDHVRAAVNTALLEKYPDGVLVTDCAFLNISPDVTSEMILERLSVADCGVVHCDAQQEAAVSAVSSGVGNIDTGENGSGESIWDTVKGTLAGDIKIVNASEYVM